MQKLEGIRFHRLPCAHESIDSFVDSFIQREKIYRHCRFVYAGGRRFATESPHRRSLHRYSSSSKAPKGVVLVSRFLRVASYVP